MRAASDPPASVSVRRRAVLIAVLAVALVLVMPVRAFAFKPAAHQMLLEQVVQSLPTGDPFRIAYESNPANRMAAAWGAWGPDIGLGTMTVPLEYTPWMESWHNDRAGTVGSSSGTATVHADAGQPAGSPVRSANTAEISNADGSVFWTVSGTW